MTNLLASLVVPCHYCTNARKHLAELLSQVCDNDLELAERQPVQLHCEHCSDSGVLLTHEGEQLAHALETHWLSRRYSLADRRPADAAF